MQQRICYYAAMLIRLASNEGYIDARQFYQFSTNKGVCSGIFAILVIKKISTLLYFHFVPTRRITMSNPDETNQHLLLQQTYGFPFPADFFSFWHFANTRSSLFMKSEIGIQLTGPFDLLQNPTSISAAHDNPLWKARYYDDPPEFLTVATGPTDGLHWGYYLDDPQKPPFPLAYYYSNDAFELSIAGNTLFEVVRLEIELFYRDNTHYMQVEPDSYRASYQTKLARLALLREALQTYETGDRSEVGQEYIKKYSATDTYRQITALTRDGMGIVVPAAQYIPLTGDDIFQTWHPTLTTQEVQPRAQEAMQLLNQGYPGAALKLGKDLWLYQNFRDTCYALLDAAYAALNRPLLRKLLKLAIAYRAHCDSKHSS